MSNSSKQWTLTGDGSWLAGQQFVVKSSPMSIGRGSQCSIVIPGKHLSRQHAEFHIKKDGLHVKDLGSANGTFINGKQVSEGLLRIGDRLKLDVYSFVVSGPKLANSAGPGKAKTKLRSPEKTPLPQSASAAGEPKKWKTKATSPGNRHHTVIAKKRSWTVWVNTLIIAMTVGLVVWLLRL